MPLVVVAVIIERMAFTAQKGGKSWLQLTLPR
jgi:hypothetical protein